MVVERVLKRRHGWGQVCVRRVIGRVGWIRSFPGEKRRGSGMGWSVEGGEGRPWEVDWRTVLLLLTLGLVLVVVSCHLVGRACHLVGRA